MDMLNVVAWQAANPNRFLALRLELPGGVWRWSSGGEQRFVPDGALTEEIFLDDHPDFGFVTGIGLIRDGAVASAIAPDIEISPATQNGLVELEQTGQGARWTLWQGLVERDTGAVIGTPTVWESAVLNKPALRRDKDTRSLRFTSMTADQLIVVDEDAERQTDAFHQSIWPGELGFSQVINVNREVYVRTTPPVKGGVGGAGGNGGAGGGAGTAPNSSLRAV
jgi:hypothetical protein